MHRPERKRNLKRKKGRPASWLCRRDTGSKGKNTTKKLSPTGLGNKWTQGGKKDDLSVSFSLVMEKGKKGKAMGLRKKKSGQKEKNL